MSPRALLALVALVLLANTCQAVLPLAAASGPRKLLPRAAAMHADAAAEPVESSARRSLLQNALKTLRSDLKADDGFYTPLVSPTVTQRPPGPLIVPLPLPDATPASPAPQPAASTPATPAVVANRAALIGETKRYRREDLIAGIPKLPTPSVDDDYDAADKKAKAQRVAKGGSNSKESAYAGYAFNTQYSGYRRFEAPQANQASDALSQSIRPHFVQFEWGGVVSEYADRPPKGTQAYGMGNFGGKKH